MDVLLNNHVRHVSDERLQMCLPVDGRAVFPVFRVGVMSNFFAYVGVAVYVIRGVTKRVIFILSAKNSITVAGPTGELTALLRVP